MANLWALLLITGSLAVSTSAGSWMRAEPGDNCWYPHVCDNSKEANVISRSVHAADLTAEGCYNLCKATSSAVEESQKCKHFRWSKIFLGDQRTCELLRTCDKGECNGICESGPADCGAVPEPCEKIPIANAEKGNVVWDCGTPDFNPYNEPIPVGTVCTASCPAWGKNTEGKENTVSRTCEAVQDKPGTWGGPTYSGDAIDNTNPPDQATACSSECADYPLWYDPNTRERGAKFYCVPAVDFSTAATTAVNLPQDGECFLFCDNMLVADIFCNNGEWTDISQDPEVGISCFGPVPPKP